ncbi:hypothetical protein [Marivirga harenae]|uniref:hypothetical protein n=1 Tax=Marivirga harenae TaxID=2010992 RepID=UPI0026E06BFE|nr:hypothetical protein [Marivirga harenae]WKV13245.1 hypothetical protein Q3Y49_05315 [Marivirga harenae]
MKIVFPWIIIVALVFSCTEDETKAPFNKQEFYSNHEAANWTKASAKEHLQGRWNLIYTYCCGFGDSNKWSAVEDNYFDLRFEGDSVKVFTNKNLERTLHWQFEERDGDALYLETEEPISNTFGTLYFSENYMLFNGSPSDGSDNYFQKVE